MNYEKKYKEALERARELSKTVTGANYEYIFPELKESEDERMLREIKRYIKEQGDKPTGLPNGTASVSDMIAWLEKQESYYTFEIKEGHWYKCVCDYMLNDLDLMFKNDRLYYCRRNWRLIGEIDERNVKDIGVNGYKSFFRPATNQEIKDWLEKQGEPEENDSEDERIRKSLINFLKSPFVNENITDEKVTPWIAWLEKQKEPDWAHSQKENEDNYVIRCLINGLRFYCADNEDATWGTDKFHMKVADIIDWLEKQKTFNEVTLECERTLYERLKKKYEL